MCMDSYCFSVMFLGFLPLLSGPVQKVPRALVWCQSGVLDESQVGKSHMYDGENVTGYSRQPRSVAFCKEEVGVTKSGF